MAHARRTAGFAAFALVLSLPIGALAQEGGPHSLVNQDAVRDFDTGNYSPYAGRNYPTRPLWGDTHLHTSASLDAFGFGDKLDADAAYRFALGEEIRTSSGQRVRLSRPLDWLAIADHSEFSGIGVALYEGNPRVIVDDQTRRWNQMMQRGGKDSIQAVIELVTAMGKGEAPPVFFDKDLGRSLWQDHLKTVEQYNDPGAFTAFAAYEWSSMPKGDNMHRVVIFRDGADRVGRIVPFSANDSVDPEDLWTFLESYESDTGGSVLALAHNGNLSSGLMFDTKTWTGEPLSKDYAERRMRWEPLYEVTQIKGDGEAHPLLSPDDAFADYETWDRANLDMTKLTDPATLEGQYARSGLRRGLELGANLGANPFKFGMIGSTDSHISLAAVEEENFLGKYTNTEPEPERWSHVSMQSADGAVKLLGWEAVSSGYAAVWATENTREAIWDAMKRKEVYATTGPRMLVRFFGGWDFDAADARGRLPADAGYAKGVPMGGDLTGAPDGKAPTFLVAALRDSYSGNLDRIQIVKGWLDADGETREKVYDVAWSGDRTPDADGKLPPVGNTVDAATATWSNTIGAPELIDVWTDPEFDPAQPAFYYARVLEIPTPRWTTYDAVRFGVELPPEVPRTTQERAYTSPIWYTPG
ncbi:MAG: DUF3604 domain-containing protein [Pseudomonadota bacterium]